MKTSILFLSAIVLMSAVPLYAAVESVVINNASGIDITVFIEYEDHTAQTQSLGLHEQKAFYVEDKCILGVTIYSGRWSRVSDVQSDDKLVIPDSWNRCQSWMFTIKKRIDGTVHVAEKKSLQGKPS